MGRRRKLTEHEQELWDLWDKLVFKEGLELGGPITHEAWLSRLQRQEADWDQLLNRTYSAGVWHAGANIANVVIRSHIWNAMVRGEYRKAEDLAKLWLTHPDASSANRGDEDEMQICLQLARFAQGEVETASTNLSRLIDEGTYRPGVTATLVASQLVSWREFISNFNTAPEELHCLASKIATFKRLGRRRIASLVNVQTVDEVLLKIEEFFWPGRRGCLRPSAKGAT